jgi:integrase
MKADTKQENLSWRGDRAYFRMKMPGAGKDVWKSLGRLAPDDARRTVKHLVEKLSLEDLQKKLGLIGRSSWAKVHQVLHAYDLYIAGVDITPAAVAENKAALQRILATVHGERFDVLGADTALLTPQLLTDYSAAMVAKRKARALAEKWDEEKTKAQLARVQRTIGSTVQHARSLFSKDALASRPYRELELPELAEFMQARVGASTVVAYDPPPAAVLELIARDAATLKLEDPAAWLALQLEVNGGLRRGSAAVAKWDWFVERGPGQVDLAVRVAKGGNSLVSFDWDLYQEMKALRQDLTEYIVPGADDEARQAVFDRLLTWLRGRGLETEKYLKPNHSMRKWYGDEKYTQHGATEAQRALGHSSAKLTSKVYAQNRSTRSLRVL